MNTRRFLSCLLLLVLMLGLLPISAAAEKDFPQILADTKKGVIQLYGRGEDATHATAWTGTGFAIGKTGEDSDTFLTNWHCVTGSGEYNLSQVEIWILREGCDIDQYGYPDSAHSVKCEVLKTTTGYPDYAIIRAVTPVQGYKALPLLSSAEVLDGTTVYALGYPGEVSDISNTQYGIDDITATNGIISQHMEFSLADNTLVLLHTAQIAHGNSGGPLITEKGAVVGLNTYGYTDDSARYMAVYIDYAMDGLDELGISYDLYSETPAAEESEATAGTEESSTEGTEKGKDKEDKNEDDNEDEGSSSLAVWGCVILAVVVISIAGILHHNKQQEQARQAAAAQARHRQEAEAQRQAAEAQRRQAEAQQQRQEAFAGQQFQLRCWNGRIVPVGTGTTIGRDPTCTIVLPENAPGVSRLHCRLDVQGNQLILTDVGSSYGTLIHGKRIPANTPVALKTGSSFCLASERFCFTVC